MLRKLDHRAWLLASVIAAAAPAAALAAPAPRGGEPSNVVRPNQDQLAAAGQARKDAILAKLTPVTEETLKKPADGDWLTWRRTPASDGFSPLKQITKANVKGLAPAWSVSLALSSNEITPVIHDGVMFVNSGSTTVAVDGATGDQLWQYVRQLPPALNGGRTAIVRSITIYGNKLFMPTPDGHMVALDVKTGKVVWDTEVLKERENAGNLRLNGGPIVAKGKVIMGATSCNSYKGGCFIFALDAETGQEAWRFNSIAQPGQPGGDTWNDAPGDERYGGSVWTSGSYDPELGLVYFGIGNTYTVGTLLAPRPGAAGVTKNDGLYTASTVALDPATGKLAWHYQHVTPEVWDLDWVYEQSLVTLPVKGQMKKLVVTGGKIALFDGVDRANGQYALSVDAGLQTLISKVDPVTGKKTINPAAVPERGVVKHFCPHSGGGRNWPATSIDSTAKVLFVQMLESCQDYTYRVRTAAEIAAGTNDMQWVQKPYDNSDGKFGRVQAISLETGKTLWTQRRRAAYASSTLATAGGLLFIGARDRYFYAYDAANGKPLWRSRLPASPSATPVTYTANGEQYVAVVAGNGGPVAWPFVTPEIENPTGGVTLQVFKLPKAGGEVPAE
jgi:alcohol dehydrogenase (cytochrome c)